MTRLIIWRHGRTEWNATGRVQGQLDTQLDQTGLDQAATTATRLADYKPDLIISSDLQRAFLTARSLAAVTGLEIELDPRLRERHFGQWQGLTSAEVRERYSDDHVRWRVGGMISEPSVETVDDLAQRVGDAFRDAAARVNDGTAVLVTHGGAARIGCAAVLGWPPDLWARLGGLGNCRWAELRHSPDWGWRLHAYNVG